MTAPSRNPIPTLCRPWPEAACFRCCPPIRPAEYDHLDNRAELERSFDAAEDNGGPTDGTTCWGLGWLDRSRRLIGCRLHPAVNRGQDRRIETGWQEKCDRELCPQAIIFTGLSEEVRLACRPLTTGLDSFSFSSPRTNPLWTLLLWGGPVLEPLVGLWRSGGPWATYLTDRAEPRQEAFILAGLIKRLGPDDLPRPEEFAGFAAELIDRLRPAYRTPAVSSPWVHRLGLADQAADFIRLGLGIRRIGLGRAEEILSRVEAELDRLVDYRPQR